MPGQPALHRSEGQGGREETVTVTKTQVLTAINVPDQFVLAVVP